ncbi:MAG: hypothetical protein PWP23_2776 [Candidatus Sumerlaeota bacterium]|nr:hypothetical protein [Candidatus Sumerlaeota bacterium]
MKNSCLAYTTMPALIGVALTLSLIAGCGNEDAPYETRYHYGGEIMSLDTALKEYHSAFGHYPARLDNLTTPVPFIVSIDGFIKSLEQEGANYSYGVQDDGQRWHLAVCFDSCSTETIYMGNPANEAPFDGMLEIGRPIVYIGECGKRTNRYYIVQEQVGSTE